MKQDKISIFTDKHISFTVDIPENKQESHAGLTYLKEIPKRFGMLYYIPKRESAKFYTKDTPWPVDFVFIDYVGNILKISTASPFSEEIHTAPNTHAVLELKGGECKRLDIQVGDTVFYSDTTITKKNEYIFHGLPFKKINHRNANIINYDNLYFIAFAESGAMGWAGSTQFITLEGKTINGYMIDRTSLNYGHILKKIFPPFKSFALRIGGFGVSFKNPDWEWINMGFGNHLFVRKELSVIFMKEMIDNHILAGLGPKCSPGYIYKNWVFFAWGILKHGKLEGKIK